MESKFSNSCAHISSIVICALNHYRHIKSRRQSEIFVIKLANFDMFA